MVLEHIGMPQPGDCRVVFSASAEELEAAIQAEQAADGRGPADCRREPGYPDRFFHIISGACGKRASGARNRSGF